jgi:hypothetical protein
MTSKKVELSSSVKQIVARLFTDKTFKDEAMANPELAFVNYSLEEEERQALKSLLGNMGRRDSLFTNNGVWF